MQKKAFILILIILNYFCIKEISTYNNVNSTFICLTEDLNEENENQNSEDSIGEEDFSLSNAYTISLNFFISSIKMAYRADSFFGNFLNPFLGTQSQPPQ